MGFNDDDMDTAALLTGAGVGGGKEDESVVEDDSVKGGGELIDISDSPSEYGTSPSWPLPYLFVRESQRRRKL